MTTGGGAVRLARLVVGEGFPLHAAQVICTSDVTCLAPTSTIALSTVVHHIASHHRSSPVGSARVGCCCVAELAIHGCATRQIGFRNMQGRLAHGTASPCTFGQIGTAMAGLAGCGYHSRVIHRGAHKTRLAGMTGIAFSACRHRNVRGRFALCRRTVMAGVTGTRTHQIVCGMGVGNCEPTAR